jgi:small subunit ribosomal protein S17
MTDTVAESKKNERTERREVEGQVVSDKMQKTIRVRVLREFKHPKYEKRIRRQTIYIAHDEKEEAHVGDTVLLTETRPLSKTKRWRLVKVTIKAE